MEIDKDFLIEIECELEDNKRFRKRIRIWPVEFARFIYKEQLCYLSKKIGKVISISIDGRCWLTDEDFKYFKEFIKRCYKNFLANGV